MCSVYPAKHKYAKTFSLQLHCQFSFVHTGILHSLSHRRLPQFSSFTSFTASACFISLLQSRQRPFRMDGGRCGKGAPSSGEKIVVLPAPARLQFPAQGSFTQLSLGGGGGGIAPRPPWPRRPACTV